MHNLGSKKSFTLIELLIVIAIIGILAAILIPNLMRSREVAKVRAMEAYMRNLHTAGIAYLAEHLGVSATDTLIASGGGGSPATFDCSNGWDVANAGEYVVEPPNIPVVGCVIIADIFDLVAGPGLVLSGFPGSPSEGLGALHHVGLASYEMGATQGLVEYVLLLPLIAISIDVVTTSRLYFGDSVAAVSNSFDTSLGEGAMPREIITSVMPSDPEIPVAALVYPPLTR